MNLVRSTTLVLFGLALLAGLPGSAEETAKDQALFNQGKILMFDKKWEEARGIFQRVIHEFPSSNLTPQAYYFTARCLQLQGKEGEALQAYEHFLQKYPNEPFLPAEARNAVVDLAASLMEKGNNTYRDRVTAGLTHPKKEVRYFSALRSSHLSDRKLTSLAVPVLRDILAKEKERDLVDRAKIALLRLDPGALSQQRESTDRAKNQNQEAQKMFHIQVFEGGSSQATVEINLPLSFAQLAVMALDDSKKEELRRKGFEVDNIWESLKRLGPTDILTIRDGKDLVKIWID